MVLGGMRGALSVALVASLPSEGINGHGLKDLIVTLTFGVVLLSIVIQYIGLTKYVKKAFEVMNKGAYLRIIYGCTALLT